jgi:hypothetical protein
VVWFILPGSALHNLVAPGVIGYLIVFVDTDSHRGLLLFIPYLVVKWEYSILASRW